MSSVPDPVVKRYLPDPASAPVRPWTPSPRDLARPLRRSGLKRPRRPPGPGRISARPPGGEQFDDDDERLYPSHRQETTRDIAERFGVTPATVRQWVARGHLVPCGKLGPAHLFDIREALDAVEGITGRRKGTGPPGASHSTWSADLGDAARIAFKHYDAVVTISDAAVLVGVRPATVRSWLHRGLLERLPSSTTRSVDLRLGDVIAVARRRRPVARRSNPRPYWGR